jgi:hypothetical protein
LPGNGSTAPADRPKSAQAARAFRRHAWAYAIAAGALIAANRATGGGWWSFWPLAVWGVVLGVHYLVHKSRTVDDGWVEERTADLRSKSYDAGHIDTIARGAAGTDGSKAGEPK